MEPGISGISALPVDQMVTLLSGAYTSLIRSQISFKNFPSVMLWGPPGVGKSQGIRAVAAALEKNTGKHVHITDVRLLLFNPVDLRGIPTANADKTLAVWLKPKIFQMDESADVVNILFLDEISAAPPSVQAAAYQITLDRMVGEHRLPENCIVVAAGNRVTDKSVAYNMPKALANRLCHLEIREDADSWHNWAVAHGIHPYVVGFLEYNSFPLMRFEPAETDLAFPTPRSWEMVSRILNTVSDDLEQVYPLIVGCIGEATGQIFRSWCSLYGSMPALPDIFSGKTVDWPEADELQIVLRSAMVAYARQHPDREGVDRSIDYACKLPWQFRLKLLRDYQRIGTLLPVLRENPVWQAARKKGAL